MVSVGIAVIIIGGGSFYGGMKYTQSKAPVVNQRGGGNFGAGGANGGGQRGGQRAGGFGGGTSGEIISKDDKSITVKMRDGGSKIIFLGDSTQIMKSTSGSNADLIVGQQVMAMDSANVDGSVTAQTIQIRPAGFASSTQKN